MALFDDRRFLLSHINHSFITGDDTGISEVVMLDKDVFENQHQRCLKLEGASDESLENRLDPEAFDLDYESELIESEQGQSYDIASDLDYICHRRRSNTAQRLDRLKKEKINQSRTTTIMWRCDSPTNSQNDDKSFQELLSSTAAAAIADPGQDQLNSTKSSEASSTGSAGQLAKRAKSPPTKSGLTKLLEKYPSLPKNPFDEFAKFDGGMSESVHVKKIMIFIATNYQQQLADQQQQQQQQQNLLAGMSQNNPAGLENRNRDETDCAPVVVVTSSPETDGTAVDSDNQTAAAAAKPQAHTSASLSASTDKLSHSKPGPSKDEPLEVVIVSTARVQDLIGLICWQYTNEGREPRLNRDINKYCLRIAEDNGEVDPDFTSLNPNEPLSKYNFPSLALTERSKERVRNYNDHYTNGTTFNNRLPLPQNLITSSNKMPSSGSKLAALTRILFKDAKLDTNQ